MFQKSIFSTRARDHFWRDMGANPVFGLFYLKSYDDEIWYVGTLCDLEYECPNRISKAPVLLPAEGGFPFGRRPKVLLAVGELFVRARSARSQARSACVIARRRLALPPRGTKTSTPTAEGRWGAANLSAKPKVRRPPQARRGEAASIQ